MRHGLDPESRISPHMVPCCVAAQGWDLLACNVPSIDQRDAGSPSAGHHGFLPTSTRMAFRLPLKLRLS